MKPNINDATIVDKIERAVQKNNTKYVIQGGGGGRKTKTMVSGNIPRVLRFSHCDSFFGSVTI
jgi:hypothetical protein